MFVIMFMLSVGMKVNSWSLIVAFYNRPVSPYPSKHDKQGLQGSYSNPWNQGLPPEQGKGYMKNK